jgi:predicted phage baseplate assembly protein
MALIAPTLDDRKFQDLVDEAKKRIKSYCPEWTDHNVSDPGITLIELFAWMTDLLLYRFNQVPDRHYIKFLEMLGVRLKEPVPARTLVTFWLNEPLVEEISQHPVCIPAFTEVATIQTETEPAIVFTTDRELCIEPPELREILTGKAAEKSGRSLKDHNVVWFKSGFEGISVFLPKPEVDDVL